MNPKVSIIVPIYNVQDYLIRCVESLINQTLKDIEIILVNDGSKDNSRQIMEELSLRDSRIKSFNKENGGLSDARNFGISKSTGEYLAFVDSDDWIDPTMMEIMLNTAIKNNCEMVICNLQKVNEKGEVFRKLPQMPNNQNLVVNLKDDFSCFGEISWFACNKIFKRELFNGIIFPLSLHFEDVATIPRILTRCNKVGFCQDYFYNYFEREGSITRNFTSKGLDMFKAISIVEKDFNNSSFKEKKSDWKNFLIINGYYSFVAYVAQVSDRKLKKEMYLNLDLFLNNNQISRIEIFKYKRFGENYLLSLTIKKKLYYMLNLIKIII